MISEGWRRSGTNANEKGIGEDFWLNHVGS